MSQLFAHDGVVIGEPHLHQGDHEVAPFCLQRRDHAEVVSELLEGRKLLVIDHRCDAFERVVHQPVDDCFEQLLFRAKVVVEGSLRRADLVEQVFDAELLVAT
jgi:hypothetical protein